MRFCFILALTLLCSSSCRQYCSHIRYCRLNANDQANFHENSLQEDKFPEADSLFAVPPLNLMLAGDRTGSAIKLPLTDKLEIAQIYGVQKRFIQSFINSDLKSSDSTQKKEQVAASGKRRYKRPFTMSVLALSLFSAISFFFFPELFIASVGIIFIAMLLLILLVYAINLKRRKEDPSHPDMNFSLAMYLLLLSGVAFLMLFEIGFFAFFNPAFTLGWLFFFTVLAVVLLFFIMSRLIKLLI
jgi:hypothetical protein